MNPAAQQLISAPSAYSSTHVNTGSISQSTSSASNNLSVPSIEEKTSKVRVRCFRACEICRKRKIKCDGQEPCAYCISSGKTCSFKEIHDNAAGARQYTANVDSRLAKVEDAIQKLLPMANAFENWSKLNDGIPMFPGSTEPSSSTTALSSNGSSILAKPLSPNETNGSAANGYNISAEAAKYASGSATSKFQPVRPPYKPSRAIENLSAPPRPASSSGAHGDLNKQGDEEEDEIRAVDEMDESTGPEKERFADKFALLTKDSLGNLRFVGGASGLMFVEALSSLQQDAIVPASPASGFTNTTSSASGGMNRAATTEIELPFFNRKKYYRRQDALPLPEEIVYPTSETADELVSTYFARIHHTFPILQQQTFIKRYKEIMRDRCEGKPSKQTAFLSTVFAVFACAASLAPKKKSRSAASTPKPGKEKEEAESFLADFDGFEFYERAQLLLWMGNGSSLIEHVQCLALLAICNAGWNTLAQSWLNAGMAIRRAQDLGLHRSSRLLPLSSLEKEMRRRVWWCVYGLDRVLSIALGRPSCAHDSDCDAEMPLEMDDTQLWASCQGSSHSSPRENYMTAFVALLQIYVIAGRIMRCVQSSRIDDSKDEKLLAEVDSLHAELMEWQANLPHCIRISTNDRRNPELLALCLIAYFVYYSAIINLHRPFIPDQPGTNNDLTSLGHCVSAARSCIRIGETTQEMLPTSHHLAFAVQYITLSGVLLLRCIQYINEPSLVAAFISDAEKCIKILDEMEEKWPASKRCKEIVSDLLVVVSARRQGGVESLQGAQQQEIIHQHSQEQSDAQTQTRDDSRFWDPVRGKRKRALDAGEAQDYRPRPRLDDPLPPPRKESPCISTLTSGSGINSHPAIKSPPTAHYGSSSNSTISSRALSPSYTWPTANTTNGSHHIQQRPAYQQSQHPTSSHRYIAKDSDEQLSIPSSLTPSYHPRHVNQQYSQQAAYDDPRATSSSAQRLSNLRTSVEMPPPAAIQSPVEPTAVHGYSHSNGYGRTQQQHMMYPPLNHSPSHPQQQQQQGPQAIDMNQARPATPERGQEYGSQASRISVNLDAVSARQEVEGLPFSGFNFLGADLFALVRPQPEQPSPQMFEQNAQVLWHAYGQGDVSFGEHPQPGPA